MDFPGVVYEELGGEAEVWPGVWVIPTPGHTAGHQSLVVRQADGTVLLAGQAHDFASEFASAQLARRAALEGGAATAELSQVGRPADGVRSPAGAVRT